VRPVLHFAVTDPSSDSNANQSIKKMSDSVSRGQSWMSIEWIPNGVCA
jgi:hypothetical protein